MTLDHNSGLLIVRDREESGRVPTVDALGIRWAGSRQAETGHCAHGDDVESGVGTEASTSVGPSNAGSG
jgi:hypothetical protein